MNWSIKYMPEAEADFAALDGSQKILVRKAIKKVSANPLPVDVSVNPKLGQLLIEF